MFNTVDFFIGMLLAVAALGWLAQRLNVAYPILLVIGGLMIGFIPGVPRIHLNPDFVFLFFLPPLLYPAALFTSWRDFRANLRAITLLAVGLVLFTTVVVGFLAHWLFGLPLAAGFVLGAIISPPDAIAATAIAQRLRVPRRIVVVLEGESLVNDATALVAYRFGVAAVTTGVFSLSKAAGEFLLVAIGGVGVGLVLGQLMAWVQRQVREAQIQVTLSLLTPFVAYVLAERIHVSGVLAVVSAGLFLGWRIPETTTSATRLQGGPFWDMIEFLLNGFVFILIGLQLPEIVQGLPSGAVGQFLLPAIILSVAVILVRILWVFPATYLPRMMFRRLREWDPCPKWQHVLIVSWTGMRGVVSLAAAMALPLTTTEGQPFPGRNLILFLTFTVILATLIVQGLSLPPLIRWLGIEDDRSLEREERAARLRANQAALARLSEVKESQPSKADALQRLRVEYEDRIRQLETFEAAQTQGAPSLFSSEYETLSFEALSIERAILVRLRDESVINDTVLRRIQHDIDLAEARLRRHE